MKKALIIGINYIGTSNELHGCINDAMNMKNFLKTEYGFVDKDIFFMSDVSEDPKKVPTKKNMIAAIKALVLGVKEGDVAYFSYSGHGSNVLDTSGDERDGKDETLVPLDLDLIIDDDLRKMLVDPLPKGVKLTCIFDCCHSGTGLDLRYNYQFVGSTAVQDYKRYITDIDKHYKDSLGDVVLLSGCTDDKTSIDAFIEGKAQGAMTYAFLSTMKKLKSKKKEMTYLNVLKNLRQFMKQNGYDQVPQLSTGRSVNLQSPFSIL